jgi:hypothetical protein
MIVGRVFNYLTSNPGAIGYDPQPLDVIYADLLSRGVNITNNSFSSDLSEYTSESRLHDQLVRSANGVNGGPPMTIYIAAGNDDGVFPAPLVTSPGTAKNVITVGGSENANFSTYNPTTLPNYSSGEYADNGYHFWSRSRYGPTDNEGRIKPDIVAPSTAIEGPRTRNSGSCALGLVGTVIDPTAPGGDQGEQHLWTRGTSFGTPLAAGAGALLYTWFKNLTGLPPKPALLKAMQITLARDLSGPEPGRPGRPPDARQGWGKADLERAFANDGRYVWENESATTLVTLVTQPPVRFPGPSAGGYRIKNATQPVRITLVWTDAPGNPGTGPRLVNNLDMVVRMQGAAAGKYAIGNDFNFSTGRSNIHTSGGTFDVLNNVEQVVFTTGDIGGDQFEIEVYPTALNGDGINSWGAVANQQNFAFFIENAVTVPPGATRFNTLTACRAIDTRDTNGPYGGPALGTGQSRSFLLRGRCGIPTSAKAVAGNLAAILPPADGYLTAYPTGALPPVSTLSYRAGLVRANNLVLTLDAAGSASVFSNVGPTNFLLDVTGYFE